MVDTNGPHWHVRGGWEGEYAIYNVILDPDDIEGIVSRTRSAAEWVRQQANTQNVFDNKRHRGLHPGMSAWYFSGGKKCYACHPEDAFRDPIEVMDGDIAPD